MNDSHTTTSSSRFISLRDQKQQSNRILDNVSHVEVTYFLLIGWAQASVQLPALFPGIPYGEALPLAEYSLLQEVHTQLPNGFPGNR